MSNPLDEALMAKEAFFGGLMRGIKQQFSGQAGEAIGGKLVGGGAAALGGMAMAGMGAAAMKIRDSITKKRDFKEMMSLNGDLQQESRSDPKFFNAAYNSLRRINPEFGTDPVVAGAYMRKMMANPDAAGLTIAQSIKPPMSQKPFQAPRGEALYTPPTSPTQTPEQQEMGQYNLSAARRQAQLAPGQHQLAQHEQQGKLQGMGRQKSFFR